MIKHNPTVLPEDIKDPDIVASATDLDVIADESVDFVIANQILEHLPNPIKAITEFHRVLKIGGVLYLSIPDKRYTIDKERPITPVSHVIDDYKKTPPLKATHPTIKSGRNLWKKNDRMVLLCVGIWKTF